MFPQTHRIVWVGKDIKDHLVPNTLTWTGDIFDMENGITEKRVCVYVYIYICVCMYIYIYIHIHVGISPHIHTRIFWHGRERIFPTLQILRSLLSAHGSCCTAPGSEQAKCFTQQVKGSLLGVTNSYSGAFARHGIKT